MIFILEDDPARIEWFASILGAENIDVTCDYKEAVQKLASNIYERIFLDFNISDPKHNGIDVAYDMMDMSLQCDTPIIIHSDDNYGIRHMSRILGKKHSNVEAVTFRKLGKHVN